jgi:hypothetical protein
MSAVQAGLLKKRLTSYILAGANDELTDRQIFLSAISVCNHKSLGRVEKFNSLYAYHPALTTLLLISAFVTLVLSTSLIRTRRPLGEWQDSKCLSLSSFGSGQNREVDILHMKFFEWRTSKSVVSSNERHPCQKFALSSLFVC